MPKAVRPKTTKGPKSEQALRNKPTVTAASTTDAPKPGKVERAIDALKEVLAPEIPKIKDAKPSRGDLKITWDVLAQTSQARVQHYAVHQPLSISQIAKLLTPGS